MRNGIGRAERIAGLVMAGGLSSRMNGGAEGGADKALLRPWGGDGPTLLEHAHATLSSLADPVLVACRAGGTHPGFACVEDILPRCGPAGGIHAGLARIRDLGGSAALVMACDMPLMDAGTLSRLLELRREAIAAGGSPLLTLFRRRGTDRFQALAAVYAVEALPLFEEALRNGRRKLLDIIPEEARLAADFDGADQERFLNVNTPEDLAAIRETFRRGLDNGGTVG